jgi:hypothetical protein
LLGRKIVVVIVGVVAAALVRLEHLVEQGGQEGHLEGGGDRGGGVGVRVAAVVELARRWLVPFVPPFRRHFVVFATLAVVALVRVGDLAPPAAHPPSEAHARALQAITTTEILPECRAQSYQR